MVLTDGEPDDPARGHVQDAVKVELALIGGHFGAIAVPPAVELSDGELAADQVRCPPPSPPLPGGLLAAPLAPGGQPELPHHLGDGVLTDSPTLIAQVRSDSRSTIGPAMLGEQEPDPRLELSPPRVPR